MVFGLGKKKESFLSEEELNQLKNLEKEAYMKQAKELVVERGINKAKSEIQVKPKEGGKW